MSETRFTSSNRSLVSLRLVLHCLVLSVAVVTVLTACRPDATSEDGETDTTPASSGISISAACLAAGEIQPTEPFDDSEWQPLSVPDHEPCFRLTATAGDPIAVDPATSFVLESVDELETDKLQEVLLVEPPIAYSVDKGQVGKTDDGLTGRIAASLGLFREPSVAAAAEPHIYTITPREPLEQGQSYRFTLVPGPEGLSAGTWGFQADSPLRVVQTVPENETAGTPLDTGIELTFSHSGVIADEESITVEPPIEFELEASGRTVVLVPASLEPLTLYTVRVADRIGVAGSDKTLSEPFTLQFETEASRAGEGELSGATIRFSRLTWEVPTEEAPLMSLYGVGEPMESGGDTVAVAAYRFDDAAAFIASLDEYATIPDWAYSSRESFLLDTSALTRVAGFEAFAESGEPGPEAVFAFPEPLEAGYYLVEASRAGSATQAWLQVTDISTYVAVSDSVLLWVNDVATGGPVEGASVSVAGTELDLSTDPTGVAFFSTPEQLLRRADYGPLHVSSTPPNETVGTLLITTPDGREAVVPLDGSFRSFTGGSLHEMGRATPADDYWHYLYSDRTLYRMTDDVRFWGIARERQAIDEPLSVTVELLDSGTMSLRGEPALLGQAEVTTGASGAFIGQLGFEGASPGFYTLRARVGDTILTSTSVEVRDFVTPAYGIEVSPAQEAVIAGADVTVTVSAEFFEGSPVPGMELSVMGDVDERLTTDSRGTATFTFSPQPDPDAARYSGYRWANFMVHPVLAEESEISSQGWVRVFPSELTLDADWDVEGNEILVRGTVSELDLERVNAGTATGLDDYRGAPAAGVPLTAEVTELTYQREEVGEYYDYVSKRVRKEYRYNTVETPLGTLPATTAADGTYQIAIPAEDGRQYRVAVRVTDGQGRTALRELYAHLRRESPIDRRATLHPLTEGPYSLGDEVALEMRSGDAAPTDSADDPYIFLQARNGIMAWVLHRGPEYTFQFGADHIPNVNIVGVRFVGHTYQESVFPLGASFDESQRRLAIELAPDREDYSPGDQATIDVSVTDAQGAPVEAQVLLSAIDEAIYRLQGEGFYSTLDILESLYTDVRTGIITTYVAHRSPKEPPGAEGGGGGGVRDSFKDTAVFTQVATDSSGRGSVSFELPDNLTSWRVTSLAASDDLQAGSAVTLVPVTKPLFVDVSAGDTYVAGDEPVVQLRAYGRALVERDPVAFELHAPTLLDEPARLDAEAFVGSDVALPRLPEGRHVITASVAAQDLTDAVVREVQVLPSRMVLPHTLFSEILTGEAYEPPEQTGSPVTVVIADRGRGRYYSALRRLAGGYGDRIEAALARAVATELLASEFGESAPSAEVFNPGPWQTEEGGLSVVPWGGSDLRASALAADVAPDRVGRQALVRYFSDVLNDPDETAERLALALYGLAALGEPVMADVATVLGSIPDSRPEERLLLGLASAALGDHETARSVYRSVLAAHGEGRGTAARIGAGDDRETTLRATALASLLGSKIADGNAPLLLQYTLDNSSHETLLSLEQVGTLQEMLPRLASMPARVKLSQRGDEEITLDRGSRVAMVLSSAEFAALGLQVLEGTAGVAATTLAPVEAANLEADPDAVLNRSYETGSVESLQESGSPGSSPSPDQTIEIAESELVRVTLSYELAEEADDGCYQVMDILPSGLRAVTSPMQPGAMYLEPGMETSYPYKVENGRVHFCAFRYGDQEPLMYYARVAATGRYGVEPALIRRQGASSQASFSSPLSVEIR